MLTLGVTDGTSFVPVSQVNMSSSNPQKETQGERKDVKDDLPGSQIRKMATKKATDTMLDMISQAKGNGVEASYLLADSWFINPAQIVDLKQLGLDVVGMMKKGKAKLMHEGKMKTVKEIFRSSKKRRGRSRYLLSTQAWITTDDVSVKVRLVFVRNRNEYLVIVSTDLSLTEDEIITKYSYRWSIECFFKVFKGTLNAVKRCRALDYDQIHANNAIALLQYQMLSYLQRISTDERTIGELFWYIFEDDKNTEFEIAMNIVMALFAEKIADEFHLSRKKVAEMLEQFLSTIPCSVSGCLKLTA